MKKSWIPRYNELLREPVYIEELTNGFLINEKFVVAAIKNKWRVRGKSIWYYFKNVHDFVERYVNAD